MSGDLTSSHWGPGVVRVKDGRIESVDDHPNDLAPSQINQNIASSLNGAARVLKPAIRSSWLAGDPGKVERGRDTFVEVDWDTALDAIASSLTSVKKRYGNESIFAGSYGWASAGRFHHAQSQLKRFLNTQGGFVASEGNYSYNAALGLMPHIVMNFRKQVINTTRFSVIAKHTKLFVMFGGMAERNTQVSDGGVSNHRASGNLKACAKAGVSFVNISPLRSDAMSAISAEWIAPYPGSDTAIMMGLAHTLLTENLHDQSFLDRYTVGFEKFAAYLTGNTDSIVKDVFWAAERSGVDAERIRELARQMAANRTMISVAAGLQRADYGEQPLWMAVTLACMLGQIGLPGGGYTIGYAVNGNIGNIQRLFRWGSLGQGNNPVKTILPVAMISEMLLNPGGKYSYNGEQYTFPDAKLVWWAGGNPFHHHQDLNRLRRAFQTPETVIVNEINWTSTARHADIVLPVAASQERTDIGGGQSDDALIPMPMHAPPPGDARTEYDIYTDLAAKLGSSDLFTEGRSSDEWLQRLWEDTQNAAREEGIELPPWEKFIQGDIVTVPDPSPEQVLLAEFRADPLANALPTPSGKIEIYSETIASFGYKDCPGHATWFEPRDKAAGLASKYPLYLISGQPGTRLHSQLDNGSYSMKHKVQGREPVLINPLDAKQRQIAEGDIVELFNDRGRCLAGAVVTDDVAAGCIFLWTGAWYDPDFTAIEDRDRHGNPNVLTHDIRTSSLTQSPAAHSALVEIACFEEKIPTVTVHRAPEFVS